MAQRRRPPKHICGATSKSTGKPCQRPAGWGTPNSEGRCKFHGGSTPVKSGRYSKITRPRIRELLEQFDADPDPMNLAPEVQLLRALLTDFIERYDQFVDAMHAWHATHTDRYRFAYDRWREKMIAITETEDWRYTPADELPQAPDPLEFVDKPRQVLDITAAAGLVDKVGRMVERIEKIRAEGTISLETLDRVLEQCGVELVKAVQEEVSDPATRAEILGNVERRWGTIRLDTTASSPTGPAGRTRPLN